MEGNWPEQSQRFRSGKTLPPADGDNETLPPKEDMSMLSRKNAIKYIVTRICLVGEALAKDQQLATLLKDHFHVEVVPDTHVSDPDIVFVVNDFDSPDFAALHYGRNNRILGPTIIREMAARGKDALSLPRPNKPIFSLAMDGVKICISNSCGEEECHRLTELVGFMGGRVARRVIGQEILVTTKNYGESYRMDQHRLLPFAGLSLFFSGFKSNEIDEMTEQTVRNKGTVVYSQHDASHIIVEGVSERSELAEHQHKVTKQWFWKSIDKGYRLEESRFFPVCRKRKSENFDDEPLNKTSKNNCSKDSFDNLENSNASVLSGYSSDDIDKPTTSNKVVDKRYQVCLEMLETESNYLKALRIMVDKFKTPLEERNAESEILTKSEMAQIFGKLPALIQTHSNIERNLRTQIKQPLKSDNLIGKIWTDFHADLLKIYPPFINSYDTAKEMLEECDRYKHKFHNFLKATESQPECCRNTLKELLIRPVQRLPSVILLLKELLKRTHKKHPDYGFVKQAIELVEDVLKQSNENRRQTDTYAEFLEVLHDIHGLPADMMSSHRQKLGQIELNVLLAGDPLKDLKGRTACLFVLSDYLLITKVRHGAIHTPANLNATQRSSKSLTLTRSISFVGSSKKKKKYKYCDHLTLNCIRKIERVTVKGAFGIYVLTLRDPYLGDFPMIVQPSGDFSTDGIEDFLNVLCVQARTVNRELTIEIIDDDDFQRNPRSEVNQLLHKIIGPVALDSTDHAQPKPTLRRSSTLSRISAHLPRSLSRISMLTASRSGLPSISEVSKRQRPY
ncbi:hypothetical protein QR680_007003 [Steinernema hermaphroditum]|uniref:DH domain-containing protein n=1 Tax=Steinernema hermaphroditum TaxID=289476 RepID=A0AA39LXF6_9BILA|nr:hypothetical protein QR680_007003 [Steinernema hermaphroditum]